MQHWEPCRFLSEEHGCSIYAERPKCCREWECLWLHGLFGEELRPDKSGVIFDLFKPRDTTPGMERGGILLFEVRLGAIKAPAIQALIITALRSGESVLVKRKGEEDYLIRPKEKKACRVTDSAG